MSNVIQQKHDSLETSYDIMESLKDMFAHQSRRARFKVIRTLQNICMKPGTLVKDYMLSMIGHFNVAKNLGATIDANTQVDMVLNSLPDIFSQFNVDYHLHKMDMPLTELMNELQNVESGLKAKCGNTYAAIGSSSDSKPKGKGGKKRKRANKKPGSNKKTKANGKLERQVFQLLAKRCFRRAENSMKANLLSQSDRSSSFRREL
ncbi:Uncharacterized protein Adt_03205 [Abeliophyllum distichum]|uniref:Uncharacterized protein n=1 Tax=Abeliophyllum distichum TaxID=126358 RepID=A0ABD1VY29_9LAMI